MNPLYAFVQELKNRIAAGEISGPTALDLFYQFVHDGGNQPIRPASAQGATQELAPIADPVPEPASEEPADGQTAVADTE